MIVFFFAAVVKAGLCNRGCLDFIAADIVRHRQRVKLLIDALAFVLVVIRLFRCEAAQRGGIQRLLELTCQAAALGSDLAPVQFFDGGGHREGLGCRKAKIIGRAFLCVLFSHVREAVRNDDVRRFRFLSGFSVLSLLLRRVRRAFVRVRVSRAAGKHAEAHGKNHA